VEKQLKDGFSENCLLRRTKQRRFVVQIHAGTKKTKRGEDKNGETQRFFGKAFFSKERF